MHNISMIKTSFIMNHIPTPNELRTSFTNNDVQAFRSYSPNVVKPLCSFFIDAAIESGQSEMAKVLTDRHECRASLYAVQMAMINGHNSTAFRYLSATNGQFRNGTDIRTVHYRPKSGWSDTVPPSFQFDL